MTTFPQDGSKSEEITGKESKSKENKINKIKDNKSKENGDIPEDHHNTNGASRRPLMVKSRPLSYPQRTSPTHSPDMAVYDGAEHLVVPNSTDSPLLRGSNPLSPRQFLDRKQSSPMMPAFMTSAPGKVIVFGEHAVVYGKPAMAASISLRSYLLVTALSKSKRTIALRFPDIALAHTWHIDDLPWDVFSKPGKKKFYYDLVTSLDPDLVQAMSPHIANVSPQVSVETRKIHQNAASAFLYLFLSLGSQSFPACIYTLRSTLPIGAGLGSSASISVCMSAALLLQIRALAGPHPDQPIDESVLQIERINRWAFVSELCIHGNPSGVDNTVASGGSAVIFKRVDYSKPPTVKPLRNFPELPLLLVNTRQDKSTAAEVAKVSQLRQAQPATIDAVLDAIGKVTEAAQALVSAPAAHSSKANARATEAQLGRLFHVNHGLLVALGVSHPRLERIRELVDATAAGWTKLTGAGGGGCAITLLRTDCLPGARARLDACLDAEGFECFETTLGGDGVGVLWPAVLDRAASAAADTDDEGGEEIDQEKFLMADGRQGVERLVGVGRHERREGWKFWR